MTTLSEFSQQLSAMIAEIGNSVVGIYGNRYSASGIYWQSGIIVTSYESINVEDKVRVRLPQSRTVEAGILGSDPTTDIAVLQVQHMDELVVPKLAESASLGVGNLVLGIGRSLESDVFASLGIIQMLGPSWHSRSGGMIDQLIRVDLNLNRRGAGGPLVNAEGKIIGFNTFGPRRSILTIPATTIDRIVSQLRAKGRIPRGYLGLAMQSVEIPQSLQSQLAITYQRGLMVFSLEPSQAAERAGILPGDILVSLNGRAIEENRDLQSFLDPQSIGQNLTVQLIRGGEMRQLDVTVGEH